MVVGDRRHTRHSLPLPWYVQVKMVVLPSFADGGWTRDLVAFNTNVIIVLFRASVPASVRYRTMYLSSPACALV